jgi:DNA-binding NtrC family response regulator
MSEKGVLIIDDEENFVASVTYGLAAYGFDGFGAGTAAAGLEAARRRRPHAVLLDQMLPDGLGIDLIAPLRALDEAPAIIMISAHGDIPTAVEAVRRGARDFIAKPFELDDLVSVLRSALAPLPAPAPLARPPSDQSGGPPFQVEVSGIMRRLAETVTVIARSSARIVLLLGASGVGKGYTARAIHDASPRAGGPFIIVNCASLPGDLLESELFGVERGAYTGATRPRSGLVEAAQGGTLFLDEIGEVPPPLQAKLLRFLESRCYRRLGATREQTADLRVIAASNRDLALEVSQGRFRADLFYRLNVMPLTLPGLAERGEDVMPLARHFAARAAALDGISPIGFSHRAAQALTAYGWPGNVRELANLVERLTILQPGRRIDAADLPPEILGLSDGAASIGAVLEDTEREILIRALRAASGHKGRAAEALGISRHALKRRLQRVGLGER